MSSEHRNAVYKMYVDITQSLKQALQGTTDEQLKQAIGGYLQMVYPPEGAEDVTLTPDEMKQTALLAAQSLSRQLYERVK